MNLQRVQLPNAINCRRLVAVMCLCTCSGTLGRIEAAADVPKLAANVQAKQQKSQEKTKAAFFERTLILSMRSEPSLVNHWFHVRSKEGVLAVGDAVVEVRRPDHSATGFQFNRIRGVSITEIDSANQETVPTPQFIPWYFMARLRWLETVEINGKQFAKASIAFFEDFPDYFPHIPSDEREVFVWIPGSQMECVTPAKLRVWGRYEAVTHQNEILVTNGTFNYFAFNHMVERQLSELVQSLPGVDWELDKDNKMVRIEVKHENANDAWLNCIADEDSLRSLRLIGPNKMTTEGLLAALGKLANLEHLRISQLPMDDDALISISEISSLRVLELPEMEVRPQLLDQIRERMPNLKIKLDKTAR